MAAVLARVVAWISDAQPGWIRVEVPDADGRVLAFEDKAPMFTDENITATTPLPKDLWVECEADDFGDCVRVVLRHIETTDGRSEFFVTSDRVR